jgi:putative membrane protein
MMKWFGIGTAVVALVATLGISPVGGQEQPRGQSGQEPRTQPGSERSAPQQPAHTSEAAARKDAQAFVNEMTIANLAEVQLGQMATEKAADNDVKAYGQMMVKDHTKANDELKQVASQLKVQPPAQVDQKHKDLADKLSKLQGAQFDREYVNAMVQGHQEVLGKLRAHAGSALPSEHKGAAGEHPGVRQERGLPNVTTTAARPVAGDESLAGAQAGRGATTVPGKGDTQGRAHGDDALTQWAAKTIPVVQMHLDRAKELQSKVAK